MIRRSAAPRAGAVVPMVALLLVVLLGMVAFAVDVGYICVVQKELQNARPLRTNLCSSQTILWQMGHLCRYASSSPTAHSLHCFTVLAPDRRVDYRSGWSAR